MELLRLDDAPGKRLLATTVLGSGMASLDATVANVALPHIGTQFHAPLSSLQWVISGYALTLAAFILVGGSLGDKFGRKRVYGIGVAAFAGFSIMAALSPNIGWLIAARLAQGFAGALLTPGSLAIIQASFRPEDRMRAIGAWTGMLGVTSAAGPLVGGWLVEIDWRLAFWINVPLAAVVLWLLRTAPESVDPTAGALDIPAILLTPLALGGLSWSLSKWPDDGASVTTLAPALAGLVALALLIVVERRKKAPMVPLQLFADRTFSAINAATFVVYAALSGSMFFIPLYVQVSAGWSPLAAGAASVPTSIIMFFLAAKGGVLSQRFGPRAPMLVGMAILAVAFVWMAFAPRHPNYWLNILPGVVLMGLGLSALVAPLTGTVLAAAPDSQAGIASGINNAIARSASLFAVAGLPLVASLSGEAYRSGGAVAHGFAVAMWWCAAAVLLGGVLTWFGLERTVEKGSAK